MSLVVYEEKVLRYDRKNHDEGLDFVFGLAVYGLGCTTASASRPQHPSLCS